MRVACCFLIILILNLSCGITSNAYLTTTNSNIKWIQHDAFDNKNEIPRIVAFQDDKYLYCWDDVSKYQNFYSEPLFYQIDKTSLDIVKSSKSKINQKYNSLKVFWTEKAGWIIFDENRKNKTADFKLKKISLDSLESAIDLFQIDYENFNNLLGENFQFNNDSTLLTYYSIEYLSKSDKVRINVLCYDYVTMKELWKNQYIYPYPIRSKAEFSNINISINNTGELQFIIKSYFDKKNETKKNSEGVLVPNYNFNFFLLPKSGGVQEYNIDTKNNFIRSFKILNQKNNNPLIAAYTYKNTKFNELYSIFLKEFNNQNKTIVDIKEIVLNTKQLVTYNEVTGDKINQQNEFINVDGLQIQNMIKGDDGAIYVLGEENELKQICNLDSRGLTTCSYYWQSGNIIVTKLSALSESWTKVISKSQYISTSYGNNLSNRYTKLYSHKSFLINNKLHLFFNDNQKNYIEGSELKRIKVWRGNNTSFIHTIIEPDGKYDMIEALKPSDHPLAIDINSIKPIDSNHIFIFDYKAIGILNF